MVASLINIMIVTSSIIISGTKILHNGAVAVYSGTILAVGSLSEIIKKYPGHQIHHIKKAVLLPGLINLHTHLELPPLPDIKLVKTFSDWILNLITAKKNLKNRDYSFAAQKNIESIISSGTTTVGEICTHGESPFLLEQSGLRSIIYHEIISMDIKHKDQKFGTVRSIKNIGLIQHGLSPHSPYTVSEQVLNHIKKTTEKHKLKLCMHVAESKDEIRLLQRKRSSLEKLYQFANWNLDWAPTGTSSFEYLNDLGILSPDFLAVHAVQAADSDISLIKRTGTAIAHCPRSNRELRAGRMPLKKFLHAGITVGLGTDSLASSPSLNLWDEMRYAYKIHKKDGITPKTIFSLATSGGAEALGMAKETGTIEPWKKADLIAVPLPGKDTGDLYSDLLRETKSCIMNIVNGKIILDAR